jgi:hypothetical protein
VIVENIVIADYVAEASGKVHILGAGITRLTPPTLPVVLPTIAVFVRMRIDAADAERDHVIDISLREPGGKVMGTPSTYSVPGTDLAGIMERSEEDEIAAVQVIAMQIGPVFSTAGTYSIVVTVDGEQATTYPLVVFTSTDK